MHREEKQIAKRVQNPVTKVLQANGCRAIYKDKTSFGYSLKMFGNKTAEEVNQILQDNGFDSEVVKPRSCYNNIGFKDRIWVRIK